MKTLEQTTDLIRQEVIDHIIENIENYSETPSDEIFDDMFNSDYWIIGTYQAKQWLSEMETLNCLEICLTWERDTFGEVSTPTEKLTNAEHLVNLTVYCVADEVWVNMLSDLDYEQEDILNPKKVINYFKEQ